MGQPVIYFEIGCRNLESTQQFYAELFDWKMKPSGISAHIDTEAGRGIQGHITSLGHEPHNFANFYVEVPDLHAYLKKVEQLGGKTIVPPVDLPNGSFAWFSDPEGTMLGLWKQKT